MKVDEVVLIKELQYKWFIDDVDVTDHFGKLTKIEGSAEIEVLTGVGKLLLENKPLIVGIIGKSELRIKVDCVNFFSDVHYFYPYHPRLAHITGDVEEVIKYRFS